ncbi:hypothetical protein TSOC_013750, partial [Tetrabaena socialis]
FLVPSAAALAFPAAAGLRQPAGKVVNSWRKAFQDPPPSAPPPAFKLATRAASSRRHAAKQAGCQLAIAWAQVGKRPGN